MFPPACELALCLAVELGDGSRASFDSVCYLLRQAFVLPNAVRARAQAPKLLYWPSLHKHSLHMQKSLLMFAGLAIKAVSRMSCTLQRQYVGCWQGMWWLLQLCSCAPWPKQAAACLSRCAWLLWRRGLCCCTYPWLSAARYARASARAALPS